jgi:DNA (cytosine-5)-methyltransferase 1
LEQTIQVRPIVEKEYGYWPTPTANEDAAGRPGSKMQKMLGNHPKIRGTTPAEWSGGTLNPNWVEWLMGLLIGWTDLKPLEMDKFRLWLHSHGKSFYLGVDKH